MNKLFFFFRNQRAIIWNVLALIIGSPLVAHAIEELYLTPDDPLYSTWDQLVQPGYNFEQNRVPPYFSQANRVMILSDGFNDPNIDNYSVTDILKNSFQGETWIRGSLDCPEHLKDQKDGKVESKRIDNRFPLPFSDDHFDTIVMRRGLCFCDSSNHSCAGLNYVDPTRTSLFFEVARVLNKKNFKSIAALQGRFNAILGHGLLSLSEENIQLFALKQTLKQVESNNSQIKVSIINLNTPIWLLMQMEGLEITEFNTMEFVDRLKDENGTRVIRKVTFPDVLKQEIPIVDGVLIQVKSGE